MSSGGDPGLMDLRVEAEITHELVRVLETPYVADSSHERRGSREVDPRHGEKELDRTLLGGHLSYDLVELFELPTKELQLTKARRHGLPFVVGQLHAVEPSESFHSEQVGCRWSLDEVAMQHSMDLVLEPRALSHELTTATHAPASKTRRLLGYPHLGKESRAEQLGEGAGVELVGLCSRHPDALGNRGIGDKDL